MTDGVTRPRVAVTRDERADDSFSRELEQYGFAPLHLSTIRIAAPSDIGPLERALGRIGQFDWIVFTSAHAVDAVAQRREWMDAFRRLAAVPRLAAVGRATADRLAAVGIRVDVLPASGGGATALAAALTSAGSVAGARVLWPRSEIARMELADVLRATGAVVTDPAAYTTVPTIPAALPEFLEHLESGQMAAATFLSPSSVYGLAAALDGTLRGLVGRTLIASLGPTTSEAIVALGAVVDIEPAERSGRALAAALARRVPARRGDAA